MISFVLPINSASSYERQTLAGDLRQALDRPGVVETSKTRTNMVGIVPWSLASWLTLPGSTLDTCEGTVYVTFDKGRLIGISCSYTMKSPVPSQVTLRGHRVGCRMWVAPEHRNKYSPTLSHIKPAVEVARSKQAEVVWTSFNEPQSALTRRIEFLKVTQKPEIAEVWEDWVVGEDRLSINGEPQACAYRELRY